ncbi:hypothetical protein LguiA_032043 [Lonicera macranthoides]
MSDENVPSQSRVGLAGVWFLFLLVIEVGSRISATHFPQVLCRTPRKTQLEFCGPPLPVMQPFFGPLSGNFRFFCTRNSSSPFSAVETTIVLHVFHLDRVCSSESDPLRLLFDFLQKEDYYLFIFCQ